MKEKMSREELIKLFPKYEGDWARNPNTIKKTQPGAVHTVGKTFKSRLLMKLTPAMFRRFSKATRREAKLNRKLAMARA